MSQFTRFAQSSVSSESVSEALTAAAAFISTGILYAAVALAF